MDELIRRQAKADVERWKATAKHRTEQWNAALDELTATKGEVGHEQELNHVLTEELVNYRAEVARLRGMLGACVTGWTRGGDIMGAMRNAKAILSIPADDWLAEVLKLKQVHSGTWQSESESRWLGGLIEEVGELASALENTHEHTPDYELTQIAAICLNWLEYRARAEPNSQQPIADDWLARRLDEARLDSWGKLAWVLCPDVQEDHTCGHDSNRTPECHEASCPRYKAGTPADEAAQHWLAQHDAEVRGGCAKQAPRAVEAIIENLRDRQGISNEWDHIELDIQEEIREVWVTCIDAAIREAE